MSVSPDLLELLVCPESREPLVYFEKEQFLYCPTSRLKYPIENGVPVMLVDRAQRLSEEEGEALMRRADR